MSISLYPFQHNDGGRATSRRPRQSNDCTVRAFAIAEDLPYDEAYDALAHAGRKSWKGFSMSRWLDHQPGYVRLPFPAVKGERRMNPTTFCRQFPSGRYICKTAKHVFAVVDGVLNDDWAQEPDRCIYTAWRVAG